ncbi:MAG: HNH endonuclease [Deltaproteobacteria bacterium]|nr:HNH endonuclease [Deltaproteobacteria bacterium]
MIALVILLLGGLFVLGMAVQLVQSVRRVLLRARMHQLSNALVKVVVANFLVEPCARCHETEMQLLGVSPNGRSVHYKCCHCGKAKHSSAGAPGGQEATRLFERLTATVVRFASTYSSRKVETSVNFSTPAGPLRYERTTREPIPEAVRTEVWRRDAGPCVRCESREQLEFDHIIPVARGGATTVRNLQLLCKQCNLSKATTI